MPAKQAPILAIETSTDACSVALGEAGRAVVTRHLIEPRAHALKVMSLIDALLTEADTPLSAVGGICYGAGPGSFTGVRIAIALTQGLAKGADIPVLGVSSLRVLAQSGMDAHGLSDAMVAQDARMNEVYTGRYRRDHDGIASATEDDSLQAPAAILPLGGALLLGSGWQAYPVLARAVADAVDAPVVDSERLPDAASLLKIAGVAPAVEWHNPDKAAASYLRQQVANVK